MNDPHPQAADDLASAQRLALLGLDEIRRNVDDGVITGGYGATWACLCMIAGVDLPLPHRLDLVAQLRASVATIHHVQGETS